MTSYLVNRTGYCTQVLLIIAGIYFISFPCQGQSAPSTGGAEQYFVPRVPGSPTAAALERYALMPINEPSGTPDISLPLLQVQSGSLSLPLSLTYHASGIRVDDEASWVGLGWSLQAGGVITRVVRGKADESDNGFMKNFNHIPDASTLDDGSDFNLLRRVASQQEDYEADLFTYSFPGGSGSFLLGNEGAFHTMPYQPIQITYTRRGALLDFLLVDQAGTSYAFTEQEFTTSHRQGVDGPTTCSAWYLTRIISADQKDTIHLTYDHHTISYRSNYYQSLSVPQGAEEGMMCSSSASSISAGNTSSSNNSIQAVRLREIKFRQGRIVATTQMGRADIGSDTRLMALDLLRTGQPDPVRKVSFSYSYFNEDLPIPDAAAKSAYLRLRLDAVTITGGEQQLPPHRFAYSAVRLPTRGTGSRDHWGYANATYLTSPAKIASIALIPHVRVPIISGAAGRAADGTIEVGNANREPNPAYGQAGLLQRITYPTGGYVTYAYEPNTALAQAAVAAQQDSHYQEATGTGNNTVVRNTATITMGNYVNNIAGTVAVRRYNEPGYGYLHTAGGTITVTDITNNIDKEVFRFLIKGDNNGVADATDSYAVYTSPTLPAFVANHTYKVVTEARGKYYDADVNLHWDKAPSQLQTVEKIFGGVRVKAIRTCTAAGKPAQVRYYSYTSSGSSMTSGYTLSPFAPVYSYNQTIRRGSTTTGSELDSDCVVSSCRYVMVGSQPIGELNGSDQSVGYAYVTVRDSAAALQGSGQIVSLFSTEQSRGHLQKPYPPAIDFSWKRGNLLRRWIYQGATQETLSLVEQQINDYRDTADVEIQGFRAIPDASYSGCSAWHYPEGSPGNASFPLYAQRFAFSPTYAISQWHYLARTRQYRYSPGADTANHFLTTTTYRYGNQAHAQPTVTTTSSSDGSTGVVYARYAGDYEQTSATTPAAMAVQEMARRHMNTTALETWAVRRTPTTTMVVSGQLRVPTLVNQAVAFHKLLNWQSGTPKAIGQFMPSRIWNGQLTMDPAYQEKIIVDRYDSHQNILQQHPVNAPYTAYVWGYEASQMVAKIDNATYDQVLAVLGQAAIDRLRSAEPGTDQQVRALLHPLRTQLPQAKVSTFTHQPLVGMSSQTGPDGRTLFYEYDALGRLLRVRDEQNRVLSEQEYKYATQP